MTTVIHDASTAQAQLMEKQMNALSREAEAARRALNGGAPINKEKKLREACEGFEAVFVQKMWEGMRASLPEDGLISGSKEEKFWQGMYDQELGKSIASSGGIGLADMMMGQLSKDLHKASDVTAMTMAQKPLNIEPAPLMAPTPITTADKGAGIDDMYDTPAALQGEKIVPDSMKDTSKPPAVVQAALDDLRRVNDSKLLVTTETFVAGARGKRRAISKQVRVLDMPNNAPAHLGLKKPDMATAATTGITPSSLSAEAVPVAPYAADTMLIQPTQATAQITPSVIARSPTMPTSNTLGMPLNGQQMPTQMPPLLSQQTLTMPATPFSVRQRKITPITTPSVPLTSPASVSDLSKVSQSAPISKAIQG